MLNPHLISALIAEFPNWNQAVELEKKLNILFPFQKTETENFVKVFEIPDFFRKIEKADFNVLQEFSTVLIDLGTPYNLAMPTLTSWRSALALRQKKGILELIDLLEKQNWQQVLTITESLFLPYIAFAKMQTADNEGAISDYKSILETEPQNTVIWYILGKIYLTNQDHLSAVDAFEKAVLFGFENENLQTELALARNNFENSVQQENAEYWLSYMEKLAAFHELEKLEKIAIKMLANPDFPQAEANYFCGFAYKNTDFEKAISHFDKAIELGAQSFFYTQRGIAKFNLQQLKQAAEDFKQAIKLNSEDDQARQYLEVC